MATTVFYVFAFISVYVQVFLLVTFLERRREIRCLPTERLGEDDTLTLSYFPSVTAVVPCWNEEQTLEHAVRSLLEINYPQNKLQIFLVDDGSTDGTLERMRTFKKYPNVKIFHKENGGKYTALNLALEHCQTEIFGCLDADSFAHPQALRRMIGYFADPQTMAVVPAALISRPRNLLEKCQKIEYEWAVYIKKTLGFLNALHVTPGTFSIFRRKVFDLVGPYRQAHNTEDMEIAYRIQKHHLKIEQCNDAYFYTIAPRSIGKLFKQRLRWIYGFLNNTLDYRHMLFKPQFGHFAVFTVPAGLISVSSVLYIFGRIIGNLIEWVGDKLNQISAVGWNLNLLFPHLDWFYFNTKSALFLFLFLFGLIIVSILIGRYMTHGKFKFSLTIFYFMIIYSFLAPFWIIKAVWNTARRKNPSWR